MDEKIEFKEVKIIGNRYFHHFKMEDGSISHVETTKEDYEQLGKSNPTNPTIKSGKWWYSSVIPKYDTKDGEIHDGEIAKDSDGRYIGKKDNYILFFEDKEVSLNSVSKNIIDTAINRVK